MGWGRGQEMGKMNGNNVENVIVVENVIDSEIDQIPGSEIPNHSPQGDPTTDRIRRDEYI